MINSEFVGFLDEVGSEFFLEVEAKPDKMARFIADYNGKYSPPIDFETDGVCTLSDNANKWSEELRIYLNDIDGLPEEWVDRVYRIRNYRSSEFTYRIDDNRLVRDLFDNGYRIGYNVP